MSLELEPAELGFRRPFTEEVPQNLRLSNKHDQVIAFKVKTTAPKQYCVRPNSGTVQPGQAVNVSVVLQPMKQDPPEGFKCKDKFLVQSIALPDHADHPQWPELERTYKSSIVERKIRVQYHPADGSASAHTNGVEDHANHLASSPVPAYSPRPQSNAILGGSSASPLRHSTKSPDQVAYTGQTSSKLEAGMEHSREELRKLLADAQETIVKLKNDATSSTELRQRNVSNRAKEVDSGASLDTLAVHTQQGGVPVPTVALIALIVFALTYLLF